MYTLKPSGILGDVGLESSPFLILFFRSPRVVERGRTGIVTPDWSIRPAPPGSSLILVLLSPARNR